MVRRRRKGRARPRATDVTASENLRRQCEALDRLHEEQVIDVAAMEGERLFASHPRAERPRPRRSTGR